MPGVRAFRDPLAAPKNKGLTNSARGSVGGAQHFPLLGIECTLDEQEIVRERSKQSGKGLPTGRSYDQEYGNPD